MFGDKLKDLRKEKKLTQVDIADMFNVTYSAVSAWENGKAQPSYDILTKLAEHFGVTTDYLLGYNQEDLDNLDKLKVALKESGMLNDDMESITKEDFEKAMQIVMMLKENNKND